MADFNFARMQIPRLELSKASDLGLGSAKGQPAIPFCNVQPPLCANEIQQAFLSIGMTMEIRWYKPRACLHEIAFCLWPLACGITTCNFGYNAVGQFEFHMKRFMW